MRFAQAAGDFNLDTRLGFSVSEASLRPICKSGVSNEFSAELASEVFLGYLTIDQLSANGQQLHGKTSQVDPQFETGAKVYGRFAAEKIKISPR